MKIPISQHLRYMRVEYSQQDINGIVKFLDKNIFPTREETDQQLWYNFCYYFKKLPEGKKTKAFLYQLMVVNGLTTDPLNSKKDNKLICRNIGKCQIAQDFMKRLGRNWEPEDFQNICSNLAICLILPSPEQFCLEYEESLTEILLDDSILGK